MAKKLSRKKPGYTKSGEVKIVSLSVPQLVALLDKTQIKKKKAKIQKRITLLQKRPGYQQPVLVQQIETQPV